MWKSLIGDDLSWLSGPHNSSWGISWEASRSEIKQNKENNTCKVIRLFKLTQAKHLISKQGNKISRQAETFAQALKKEILAKTVQMPPNRLSKMVDFLFMCNTYIITFGTPTHLLCLPIFLPCQRFFFLKTFVSGYDGRGDICRTL